MLRDNPISVVSEKLDGSNLSVASNGIIASRRQILLIDPKPEDLNRTKFCGEPLSSLKSVLDSAKNMQKQFFQKVTFWNKTQKKLVKISENIKKKIREISFFGTLIHSLSIFLKDFSSIKNVK